MAYERETLTGRPSDDDVNFSILELAELPNHFSR
jgi:hypothetical protein